MVNSSQFPYFILTAYLDMGYLKYLYFVIVLMLYIVIVFANALLIITSDSHTISRSMCFLQIYCLYTYASVEVCNLAVMSYDRSSGFVSLVLKRPDRKQSVPAAPTSPP
ncbi:unnamed protein product [Arctogadus glacialis]